MSNIKVITILSIFFVGVISIVFYFTDDADACLDSGVCKAGYSLNMNDGKTIIISEKTCKQYNGNWQQNICYFKI